MKRKCQVNGKHSAWHTPYVQASHTIIASLTEAQIATVPSNVPQTSSFYVWAKASNCHQSQAWAKRMCYSEKEDLTNGKHEMWRKRHFWLHITTIGSLTLRVESCQHIQHVCECTVRACVRVCVRACVRVCVCVCVCVCTHPSVCSQSKNILVLWRHCSRKQTRILWQGWKYLVLVVVCNQKLI